jgi:hypothetical protein
MIRAGYKKKWAGILENSKKTIAGNKTKESEWPNTKTLNMYSFPNSSMSKK